MDGFNVKVNPDAVTIEGETVFTADDGKKTITVTPIKDTVVNIDKDADRTEVRTEDPTAEIIALDNSSGGKKSRRRRKGKGKKGKSMKRRGTRGKKAKK